MLPDGALWKRGQVLDIAPGNGPWLAVAGHRPERVDLFRAWRNGDPVLERMYAVGATGSGDVDLEELGRLAAKRAGRRALERVSSSLADVVNRGETSVGRFVWCDYATGGEGLARDKMVCLSARGGDVDLVEVQATNKE